MNSLHQAVRALIDAGLSPRTDVPLKELSYWRIGGPADIVVTPASAAQAAAARAIAAQYGLRTIVIGHGSNLLFDDAGYRGIVIKIGSAYNAVAIDGTTVRADAGIWTPTLARRCAGAGLSGLEHTVGIPGNLGGLLYMNGGSMRRSIGDTVVWVEYIDENGRLNRLSAAECEYSYRSSVFQRKDWIITAAELQLAQSTSEQVREAMLSVLQERKSKFPLEYPNCGSVFSNDTHLYETYGPPGMVIDRLGIKGLRHGDAQVSHKHANFIVNLGSATSNDVLSVIRDVRGVVRDKTGFTLRCEVLYVPPTGMPTPADRFLNE